MRVQVVVLLDATPPAAMHVEVEDAADRCPAQASAVVSPRPGTVRDALN